MKKELPTCGCGHPDTMHDPETRECGYAWFDETWMEQRLCGCRLLHREVVINGVHELVPV